MTREDLLQAKAQFRATIRDAAEIIRQQFKRIDAAYENIRLTDEKLKEMEDGSDQRAAV